MIFYDVETFLNCFTVTFLKDDKVDQFVIHKSRDDSDAIRSYLKDATLLVGYNNINFDYKVLHKILTSSPTAQQLYKYAQKVITDEKPEWVEQLIPQLDLMKLKGYDNKALSSSLKWLEINMDWPTVQDMPFHHSHKVTEKDIPIILKYNLNDVLATKELWKRCQPDIELRRSLSSKYGDVSNLSDPRLGEHIVLKMLSEQSGTPVSALKKCRTFRKQIRISDALLPDISFKTPEFQAVHETFKNMVVTDTRSKDEIKAVLDGVEYYFGMGGIHACRKNGIYRNISSADVTGYYPSLAVSQGFHPQHFGDDFVRVYKQIVTERSQYAKGTPENYALKIAANGVFGKSNSEYSPFYDPLFFAKITINGQLLLAMLCERITIMGVGRVILANTDGIEVEVTDEPKFKWLCEMWQKKFNLSLEHKQYKLLAVRDINSYVAIDMKGEVKEKGGFITDMQLHQDHSQRIVGLAVRDYLLNGVPITETIGNCNDIKMFLMGARAKTGKFLLHKIENSSIVAEPLPKHIRYYIGGKDVLMKKDSNLKHVHKGYTITMFNDWHDGPYNINKQYYIREANKLINNIIH